MTPLKVPEYDDMDTFIKWVDTMYLPIVNDRLEALKSYVLADPNAAQDRKVKARITALQNQQLRAKVAVSNAREHPDDWVYWCDETEKDGTIANLKPLQSAPYAPLLLEGARYRIYMSAYPGDQDLFCQSLGLDPETVAWIKLPSAFKPESRPIVMGMIGSMSKKNQGTTLPALLRVVDKIMTQHHNEKGLIHCNSYVLGEKIYNHFATTVHGPRLLFPKNADERDTAKAVHEKEFDRPTVLISPSMTEGFDFKDDLARWQVIAKCPFPFLGDLQLSKKRELNPAWYALQTVSTIIQACGRIVRSEDDFGVTYILDSDFQMLWDRYKDRFFPNWFRAAMVWSKK
jgi:Rad3-related DNA helicase